jgi:Asp-tRNA(Asn)/Glu-tRNA(Gln) amidotransferase A subunit family amidase
MASRTPAALRPHVLDASAAALEIAEGRLSSEALIADCLARIAEREATVRAWTHVDAQAALGRAREIDAGPHTGWLHGLPLAFKDIIDCDGLPTRCGSPIHEHHRARADAGATAMARRAGAVVLGKTVTAEFATSKPGPTTNPHDPTHTPGGSSSGSAAAVADRMVPFALGTQTGGSIIRPASFCGVVGFKPSLGLINRYGVKQLADSLDTVGTFARSVADTGLLVAGVTGRDDFLRIRAERPERVALCRSADWHEAEPATIEALETVLHRLSSQGVTVSELTLPGMFTEIPHAHHDIEYFELARALQHEYLRHRDQLSDGMITRIEYGLACEPQRYESAQALRQRCREQVARVFGDADLLLAPSAPGEAPAGLESTGKAVFNRIWTSLDLPCITLPAHRGPNGLPVGVQFIARPRADVQLLAHAAWIEERVVA